MNRQELVKKWSPVLDHDGLAPITDHYRKEVTAVLLENQETDLRKTSEMLFEDAPANSVGDYTDSGGIAKFDPVLISLIRRTMPQLIAYDVCGVQPLTQPTGLIFAMKSRYTNQAGAEALFNEADSDFSGTGTHAGANPVDGAYTTGTGMDTADGEALGSGGANPDFNEMSFTIEKVAVAAKTRKLKAVYSLELAQDMRSIHGLDAEAELSNILSTEILAEINREVIRSIYTGAVPGCVAGSTATAGTFDLDVDANGRWSVEKFKGLMFQMEREANAIGHLTRRGRGNFIICSADVASAMQMAGVLDYSSAISGKSGLNVDDTSSTFAGVLNGKYKVFVDPYSANMNASEQFFVMGYKGASSSDAGLIYSPYIPLQKLRAVDPNTFQPVIGFQSRQAIVTNPYANIDGTVSGAIVANKNVYYRKVTVANLL